ncbi:hypothetical protein VTO42DRAFT_2053 [Malbranchea cinnamomea]
MPRRRDSQDTNKIFHRIVTTRMVSNMMIQRLMVTNLKLAWSLESPSQPRALSHLCLASRTIMMVASSLMQTTSPRTDPSTVQRRRKALNPASSQSPSRGRHCLSVLLPTIAGASAVPVPPLHRLGILALRVVARVDLPIWGPSPGLYHRAGHLPLQGHSSSTRTQNGMSHPTRSSMKSDIWKQATTRRIIILANCPRHPATVKEKAKANTTPQQSAEEEEPKQMTTKMKTTRSPTSPPWLNLTLKDLSRTSWLQLRISSNWHLGPPLVVALPILMPTTPRHAIPHPSPSPSPMTCAVSRTRRSHSVQKSVSFVGTGLGAGFAGLVVSRI